MIYKTLYIKQATRTPLQTGVQSGAPKGKQFLLHVWNPSY